MSLSTRRHPRLRALLIGASLLLSLVLSAALLSFALRPISPGVPLDPGIPNEQALIDAGLSGSPGPSQPTAPIAVDRVLVDGAATYVQYHISGPGGPQGDPLPTLSLSDDRGVPVTGDSSSGGNAAPDWPLPFPLPAWLPWRPSTIRRGYLILAPLPPTAHAAILQFGTPHSTLGPNSGETVRVPLGPHASILQRIAHPATTARAAGLTLALRDLGPAHLTYTYASRGGLPSSFTQLHRTYSSPAPPGAAFDPAGQLVDAAGHLVPTAALGTDCTSDAQGLRCATTVVFPPQPPATRLTLTISAVQVGAWFAPPAPRVTRGPWRLPFTVP